MASGLRVQDTVTISGAEIANLTFGASYLMGGRSPIHYDGILGLSPEKAKRINGTRKPFLEMIDRGLLDRNVFSLKLSRHSNEEGSLIIGGIDDDVYEVELVPMPVVPSATSPFWFGIGGRWAVSAENLAIGPGSVALDGHQAIFETEYPYIALPEDVLEVLEKHLGMERGKNESYTNTMRIDCDRRKDLEDLTITLGGMDFVLTPWEYTIEVDMKALDGEGGVRCISAFTYNGISWMNHKFIVLGSSFLRGFYSVFHGGNKTVSLAKLKGKKPKSIHGADQEPKI